MLVIRKLQPMWHFQHLLTMHVAAAAATIQHSSNHLQRQQPQLQNASRQATTSLLW
jgi:hypothetical protein